MLEVVIGLVFIFLLYSLLATIVMEMIASWFSLRGVNLERALRNLLFGGDNNVVYKEFKDNEIYKQLAGRNLGKKSPPSYLSDEKFRSILVSLLDKRHQGDDLQTKVDLLPEGSLKRVLNQFVGEVGGNVDDFKKKINLWYNDVMDRASGWYKRNIQIWLLCIGMFIAAVFNVDSLQIYDRLANDDDVRQEVATMAEAFINHADQIQAMSVDTSYIKSQLNELVNQNIESLKNPLGIGWGNIDPITMDITEWVMKVFGWILTALAISLGAPFWFDMLRKLVRIRGSGAVPTQTPVIIQNTPTHKIPNTAIPDEDLPVG
ncbi:MAG: hypothetical protein KDC44_07720 [Phaeodactylibacter sp.]|nr:hypothetical protein [Phaeodactylibacter sp.]